MQQQNQINPDQICQQAIISKMNVYKARENYDSVVKIYNDNFDNIINLCNLYKSKVLDMESKLKESEKKVLELEAKLKEKETDKDQSKLKKS